MRRNTQESTFAVMKITQFLRIVAAAPGFRQFPGPMVAGMG
jgi:hypothetical protein